MSALHTQLLHGQLDVVWNRVDALSPVNPQHVAVVLSALTEILEARVLPWLDVAAAHGLDDPFDYDEVVEDVPGMVMEAFFAPRFPNLHDPTDHELAEAFLAIEHPDVSPAARRVFYECWRADSAFRAMEYMAGWLIKNRPPLNAAAVAERLLELAARLPSEHSQHFIRVSERLSQDAGVGPTS